MNDYPDELIKYVIDNGNCDEEGVEDYLGDALVGVYDSEKDFALEMAEEIHELCRTLLYYFDTEAYIHDCKCESYEFVRIRDQVYVLAPC